MRILNALIACAALTILEPAFCQDSRQGKDTETVAVFPWTYIHGTDSAVQTVNDHLKGFLLKARLRPIRDLPSRQSWYRRIECETIEAGGKLVSPGYLIRLGESLEADWAVTGRIVWRTRETPSPGRSFDWDGWSDRTEVSESAGVSSECSLDLLIVDAKRRRTAVEARGVVTSDSLVGTGRSIDSVEDMTGIQTRIALVALTKAIQPWLDSRR